MRRFLIIVGVLIVLIVGAAIIGLEALTSGGGRNRIASALSGSLNQPVEIGGLSVSLLPTPALQATQVRIGGAGPEAAPGITLASIHVVPRLLSLLPGRAPAISHADLVGLVVSVRHTASGAWLVPGAATQTSSPAPAQVSPPVSAAGTKARAGGGPGAAPGRAGPAAVSGPRRESSSTPPSQRSAIELDALRLRDGAVRVVDDGRRSAAGGPAVTEISAINADLHMAGDTVALPQFSARIGQTDVSGAADMGPAGIAVHLSSKSIKGTDLPALFALAGIAPYPGLVISGNAPFDIDAHMAPDHTSLDITGKTAIDQVAVGPISLQAFVAPFRFEKNVFTLDPVTFTLYGGRERGTVSVDLNAPTPVFSIRTSVEGLDANKALSATTTMKDVLLGTAHMTANVKGTGTTQPAIERSLAGTVQFAVADGDIRNMPVLARINQALGITQGSASDTKFQSLSGSATIGGGQARTTDLKLQAGDLSMVGQGALGFDQSLDFRLSAVIAAAKAGQLAQLVSVTKRLQNSNGELVVPVTVKGTATSPQVSVDVGAVAKQQLQGQVQTQLKKQLPKSMQDQLQKLLPKP